MSDEILFDGRVYVSAQSAAREIDMTGDYVARLARTGTLLAPRLGRNWFVDQEAVRGLQKTIIRE
jgi:hypothetical protein